jgi:hypothetical protein
MSKITGILCQVATGRVDNAGTDGRVYLGLGGREFRLDSSADDYERGSVREYLMGEGGWVEDPSTPPPMSHVQNEEYNDPRVGFPLDTLNLTRNPVYIRFEPDGPSPNWNLSFAAALVYDPKFVVGYTPPEPFGSLWLGDPMGKVLYLTVEHWRDEMPLRNIGKLAQEPEGPIG